MGHPHSMIQPKPSPGAMSVSLYLCVCKDVCVSVCELCV